MSALSKRLDKLTGPDEAPGLILIIAKRGEGSRDAIRRCGHDPDDAADKYMVVQFVSPEEVRNGRA